MGGRVVAINQGSWCIICGRAGIFSSQLVCHDLFHDKSSVRCIAEPSESLRMQVVSRVVETILWQQTLHSLQISAVEEIMRVHVVHVEVVAGTFQPSAAHVHYIMLDSNPKPTDRSHCPCMCNRAHSFRKWEDSADEDADAEAEPETTLPQDAVPSAEESESA